jgi:2,3-bisphosphoglycerate-dependent phosphoglycerate mutase
MSATMERYTEFGESQVIEWRRSYATRPPALSLDDERHPRFDPRYADLKPEEIPSTESLQDTLERVLPYWFEVLTPALKNGRKVLVSAHGNSLRAMVKYLDKISDEEIPHLNIPTGYPLVYELSDDLKVEQHYYLGDEEEIKKATSSVAKQASLPK